MASSPSATQPVLGIFYGLEHVYGMLFEPGEDGSFLTGQCISFDGARALTSEHENPVESGLLVPISWQSAVHLKQQHARSIQHKKQFYFSEDGQDIAEYEQQYRIKTNCYHYLMMLCESSGVPLEWISDELYPRHDDETLAAVISDLHSQQATHHLHEDGVLYETCERDGPNKTRFALALFENAVGAATIRPESMIAKWQLNQQPLLQWLSQQTPLQHTPGQGRLDALLAERPSNVCHRLSAKDGQIVKERGSKLKL